MSKPLISRKQLSEWKHYPVTKLFLEVLKQEKLDLAMAAVESPVPEDQIWMYRGKVECLNSILEGDMFEQYLEGDE